MKLYKPRDEKADIAGEDRSGDRRTVVTPLVHQLTAVAGDRYL